MMDINAVLLKWSVNILIKKTSATRANKFDSSGIEKENIPDQQLAKELHKPIIRKLKKRNSTLNLYRQYLGR